jgi:hypothetical protein
LRQAAATPTFSRPAGGHGSIATNSRSRMCGARGVHLGQQCNGVFWFRWA